MVVRETNFNETYYLTSSTGLTALGNPIESPVDPGIIEKGNLNPPLKIIQTPMSLGQNLTQSSYVVFNIPLTIIPDTILDQLPIQPDSLRIKINTEYGLSLIHIWRCRRAI